MQMSRDLPSLNALRTFEAAARHGGFVGAAKELGVTPAAVSHQVKGLEDDLGVVLFVRQHRSVILTPAGEKLLPGLSDALDRLAQSVRDVRIKDGLSGPVTVSVAPGFATRWLGPRLERFMACHPDMGVRVVTESQGGGFGYSGFANRETDFAICFSDIGQGVENWIEATDLFQDRIFPVCAPVLRVSLASPTNLTRMTLIYDDLLESAPGAGGWQDWLQAAGAPTLIPAARQHYSHTTLALDAALKGKGVALGRGALVWPELRASTLVRPFDTSAPGATYRLLRSIERPLRPEAAAFRNWLLEEVALFRSENPRLLSA